jgi:hypothetical protein
MKAAWTFAKKGLFKRGMFLMLFGGVIVFSPLLLALPSSLASRDTYVFITATWLMIYTLPAGGITAIVGLVDLASKPNSLVGRRLLFTLFFFFGFFWLFAGLVLLAIGYPGSDIDSQGYSMFPLSAVSFIFMALAFILLFRREAKGLTSSRPSVAAESANQAPSTAKKTLVVIGIFFGASLALGSIFDFNRIDLDPTAAVRGGVSLVAGAGIIWLSLRSLKGGRK